MSGWQISEMTNSLTKLDSAWLANLNAVQAGLLYYKLLSTVFSKWLTKRKSDSA